MTIKQKQCLLYYLGYYVGEIDGKWGPLSKTATKAFQMDYGLAANSLFDDATEARIRSVIATGEPPVKPKETAWDDIQYFKKTEFKCKCGGRYCNGYPAEIDMEMVKIADEIRKRIGKPITVNSGVRCIQHNTNVGGAAGSQHTLGKAADLGKPSGVTPKEMAAIAEELLPNTGGIGIYSWGIHIDTRKKKSRWSE
jgi:peptidoglycan hydrolase-like protein with peptidoglycan-binding domain